MNITCQNCSKKLKLNDKIKGSLKALAPGKSLRLACPQCKEKIVLDASILSPTGTSILKQEIQVGSTVKPPAPPDITWLKDGIFEEEDVIEDVPQTLILMKPGDARKMVAKAIENIGYQASFAESDSEAMEKMQFVNYASVIYHSEFDGKELADSAFHQFMCGLSMPKRRYIFYILIGPDFSTLYDLGALAQSANLVVNDREVPELLTALRRSIPKYEDLFGGLMSELSAYNG